jgi:D-amino peptidase
MNLIKSFHLFLAVIVSFLFFTQPVHAADGLKIFIAADMEGVVGVVTGDQLGPGGFEYQRFREFMTAEVNACIEAARKAGATQFVVADSHGNGENLLIERLPEDVLVVRSWPRSGGMMGGIDASFDAAILLGHHASTSNIAGVRAHTSSSANVTAMRLNGMNVSEASMNAAIAGTYGVPVIMIAGDDAAVAEAQAQIGDIEGAVVKWSNSFHSAKSLTPAAAYRLIGEKTQKAISRLDEFEPYRLDTPVRLELGLKHYRPVQMLSYLPIIEQVDSHTIAYTGDSLAEVMAVYGFILSYRVDLQP